MNNDQACLAKQATLQLAISAHEGQFRKVKEGIDPVPYITHPMETAEFVQQYFPLVNKYTLHRLDTLISAAYAHDLLEDTDVTVEELEDTAGKAVVRLVKALTRTTGEDRWDYINRILKEGPSAVFLKLCDSMQNLAHPEITGSELYRKTVMRANRYYCKMFRYCELGTTFQEVYLAVMYKAMNEVDLPV
jgi:(p)ppGpp synthase/HD superfamily hydrolase